MHNRTVTPWLRTSRSVPFRWMAESGGHDRPDKIKVERREGGVWTALDENSDYALAFADGTRAVVGDRLYRESGPPVPLPCGGELRATPDGAELVCVEVFGRFSQGAPSQTVRIARFDRDGRIVARSEAPFPVQVPKDEPPLGDDVTTSFVGFLDNGLVFSVLYRKPNEWIADGAPRRVRAFRLAADGRWSEVGALDLTVSELWKLHSAQPWAEALGLPISDGARLLDSHSKSNR